MRTVSNAVIAATLLALSALVALAETGQDAGRFVPFVVDISQQAPIVVQMPVTLASGEIVQVTTPLTVSVELRVQVDGPGQAVVSMAGAPAPVVLIATATPALPTPTPALPTPTPAMPTSTPQGVPGLNQDVVVKEVRWRFLSAQDVGNRVVSNRALIEDATTAGKFIKVQFEVENLGVGAKTFSSIGLVDNRERTYAPAGRLNRFLPEAERCVLTRLNPNVTKFCTVYFDVALDSVGLRAHVGDLQLFSDEEAYIGLGL